MRRRQEENKIDAEFLVFGFNDTVKIAKLRKMNLPL
jgi:hypothetical protein